MFGTIAGVLRLALQKVNHVTHRMERPSWIAWFVVFAYPAYEIVTTALWGQTLGKKVLGIRVVGNDNGSGIGWPRSVKRAAPAFLLSLATVPMPYAILVGIVGFVFEISLLFNDRRQGWHDLLANSVVVDTKPR